MSEKNYSVKEKFADNGCINFKISIIEKEIIRDIKGNNIAVKFLVCVKYPDGKECKKWLEDLTNIDYFKEFGIIDVLFTSKLRKQLLETLFVEANKAKTIYKIKVSSGYQVINYTPLFVFGNNFYWSKDIKEELQINSPYNITLSSKDVFNEDFLSTLESYMNLLPCVTELLFYTAEFAIVKQFIEKSGIKCSFATVFIATSGHLKTTLSELFYLWLDDIKEQTIKFFNPKNKILFDKIDSLLGLNLLFDDLRIIDNTYDNKKQARNLDNAVRYAAEDGKANLIITGETIESVGIFSCLDRVFQIYIKEMKASEIRELKIRLTNLKKNFMPYVSAMFAEVLIKNHNEVIQFIKDFYTANNNKVYIEHEYVTRTERYAMFIKLTQKLFVKYILRNYPEINNLNDNFEKALKYQTTHHINMLQKKKIAETETNYIILFYYAIFENSSIKILEEPREYLANEGTCCVNDKGQLFITRETLEQAFQKYYEKNIYININKLIKKFNQEGLLFLDTSSRGYQKNYKQKKHYVINLKLLSSKLKE